MPILIDGNNLLYAARSAEDPERPPGRAQLCHALGRWAERSGEAVVIVVFDGPAPDAALAQQMGHERVRLMFSGSGRSADAVLEKFLVSHSAARTFTVVSTDREVQRAAKRRKATPERSDAFWERLRRTLKRPPSGGPPEPEEKRHGSDPRSTEQWLREFELE